MFSVLCIYRCPGTILNRPFSVSLEVQLNHHRWLIWVGNQNQSIPWKILNQILGFCSFLYCTVLYVTAHRTAQHSTAQHGTAQHSTAQRTAGHRAAQGHSRVLYCAVRHTQHTAQQGAQRPSTAAVRLERILGFLALISSRKASDTSTSRWNLQQPTRLLFLVKSFPLVVLFLTTEESEVATSLRTTADVLNRSNCLIEMEDASKYIERVNIPNSLRTIGPFLEEAQSLLR